MSKEKYEKLFKEIVGIELEDDVYYLFLNKKTINANNSRLDFNVFSIFYWKSEVLQRIQDWQDYLKEEWRETFVYWPGDFLDYYYEGIKWILKDMKGNFIQIDKETALFLKERLAGDSLYV